MEQVGYIYIKGGFIKLAYMTQPGSPAMAVAYQRGWEPGSYSVYTAGCFSNSNLMLKVWRILKSYRYQSKVQARKELTLTNKEH